MGIIKLSIGIDTSAAIFGIMRFNETKELRFKIVGITQKSRMRKRSGFYFFTLHFSLFTKFAFGIFGKEEVIVEEYCALPLLWYDAHGRWYEDIKIYRESSPNNEYVFALYQVGLPKWPFDPVKAQIKVVNSSGKTVDL